MENKLTENEIIKALECCTNSFYNGFAKCEECPKFTEMSGCTIKLMCNALDLINRQKAEIERLQKAEFEKLDLIHDLKGLLKQTKSEAIKATILEIDNRLSHYGKCDELHKYEVSDVLVEVEEAMVGEKDV